METLSEFHFDALCEIIRLGTGRAAQGLGEIIGNAVQASVPTVELIPLADVSASTLWLNKSKWGVVTQAFTTNVLGADILLLFAAEDVLRIVQKMMGGQLDLDAVREVESEAMCEVGNIMINACLSSIADNLHVPIESTLPRYDIQTPDEIVARIQEGTQAKAFVFASHVTLEIENRTTEGKLFFLMNADALRGLTDEIERSTQ